MLIKTEYTVIFKFKNVSTTVFLNSISQLYMSTIHIYIYKYNNNNNNNNIYICIYI